MANRPENMDPRQRRREEQRKRRKKQRRRLRLAAAVIVLGLACGAIFYFVQGTPENADVSLQSLPVATTAPATEPTEQTRSRWDNVTTVHVRAAGDLNITDSVVDSGLAGNGYDYTRAIQDVASTLSSADLTLMNLEGNICGEPYGTATTSAPNKLLTALRGAGVDVLQVANSCTINNGLIGLNSTLQSIRTAGIEPVGAYASSS